ncbi:sugar transferase [uncultured Bacteroides sp.]|uniref:sugar transferase n=1 Tax=uncultured Bacteroides sp. TaxID=162156 RepID=UPI002AAC2F02|nr:sugar transferase [uncultured Bacteroides sp.]
MRNIIKRALDILIATIALILLLPVFIPCAIILLLTGENEVLYLQERIGHRCEPFYIFKFVTMMKGSQFIGTGDITVENDPRVFPFGGFLRKTKINELPQFLNVILGSMSMVGPRPLTMNTFNYYPENVQKMIGKMKPGITGIGSVVFRDEEKYTSEAKDPRAFYKEYIAPYKGELEVWYAKNASLILDIKLILITAWVVASPKSDLPYRWLKDLPAKPAWKE